MTTIRLGPPDADGRPGLYRQWSRDLPENRAIKRDAERIEGLEAEVTKHVALAQEARRSANALEEATLQEAVALWGETEVKLALRTGADV